MDVQLALSHGQGRSKVGSGSEVINAYAQQSASGSNDAVYLVGCPGTQAFAAFSTTTETVLGVQPAFGDRVVAFTTGGIYIVDATGAVTRIGDPIAGPISSAYNGQIVVAVNGSSGIVVSQSTVQAIADPDFQPASTVQFILGFFVFSRADGSGQYFIAELYSVDFDALDFATAESAPDSLVALVAIRRELWLLGRDTVEVHGAATGSFPFAPLAGVSINYGCIAPRSALAVDQSVFWFSPDGIVYQSNGYSPLRVSTHEIEEELSKIKTTWSDAWAWTYIEDGHQFYLLTVGEQTFVFDLATRLWHKRQSAGMTQHLATAAAVAFGKILVGDENGRLLTQSLDHTTDEIGEIVMVVGSVPYAQKKFFTTAEFCIDAEVGQGATATLEYSDDNDGKDWSNRIPATMGKIGAHETIVRWPRLGRSRNKRFRVRLYGTTDKRVGATAQMEVAA